MYSEEHFCDCADDSVCCASVLMVVVLLLKMNEGGQGGVLTSFSRTILTTK